MCCQLRFWAGFEGILFPLLPIFLKLHGSNQWRYIQRTFFIQIFIPCVSIASPGFQRKGCEEWTLQRSQTGQAWFDMEIQLMQGWWDLGSRRITLSSNITISTRCRFYPPRVNAAARTCSMPRFLLPSHFCNLPQANIDHFLKILLNRLSSVRWQLWLYVSMTIPGKLCYYITTIEKSLIIRTYGDLHNQLHTQIEKSISS